MLAYLWQDLFKFKSVLLFLSMGFQCFHLQDENHVD